MQDSKLKEKQAELKQKEEELVLKGELLERRLLQIAAETDKEAVEVAEKEVGGTDKDARRELGDEGSQGGGRDSLK